MNRIVGLPGRGLASNLQIRRLRQVVQGCPWLTVFWADIQWNCSDALRMVDVFVIVAVNAGCS
jgi:hypothetical protein